MMDKNSRSLGNKNHFKEPPILVPFQGIGTRLRRSRSKDHSSEHDNIASDLEIANLKRLNHPHHHLNNTHNGFDSTTNFYSSSGTLERPKRFFSGQLNHHQSISTDHSSSSSSSFINNTSLYGPELQCSNKNGSSSALYEESRLLSHQYEEPQYLIDHNYRARRDLTSYGKFGSFQTKRNTNELLEYPNFYSNNNNNNSNQNKNVVGRPNPTTTVIPPSKLFAKTLSTYKQHQPTYEQHNPGESGSKSSNQSSCQSTTTTNCRIGLDDNNGSSPIRQSAIGPTINDNHHSDLNENDNMPTTITSSNNQIVHNNNIHNNNERNVFNDCHMLAHNPNVNDGDDDDGQDDDGDDDEPTVSLVGEELLSSSNARIQMINGSSSQQQQPYNTIMHTYTNPFQNCNVSSAYSEDTTGPMIPTDINTMRPSQLLKNSFAGSGPPPSLQSNSDRNLVSYLTQRLLSYLRAEQKTPPEMNEHRCSSRLRSFSTLTLIVLVFILVIIIIFLTAMNRDKVLSSSSSSSSNHEQYRTTKPENSRVPCLLVEDLDTTSTSHLSQYGGRTNGDTTIVNNELQSPEHPFPLNPNCPMYFPRDSSQYREIILIDHHHSPSSSSSSSSSSSLMPISFRLTSFSSWSIWFNQLDSMFINFQFYAPLRTRLALVANKNEPPSLTTHQIFKVISEDNISIHRARTKRDSQLIMMQFKHLFEPGSWYLSLVNDLEMTIPLVVNISIITNHSIHCPNNCHSHGYCHMGKCQCFPGFIGHDCADNVCPVFCGGHGQYLQGSCRCESGWKGRECTIRSNECEVSDCNGNGICIEGSCQCRSGFKGDHCDQADCIDPECSGHGVCLDGNCFCKAGFAGTNCSQPDTKLHKFFPNCSDHGVYDFENGLCMCHTHYSGPDCSQLSCSLDCGIHGVCQQGRCVCDDGWSGSNCQYKKCDLRCLEHGKCHNGTCHCQDGWMGKHCTLNGCANSCSKHGRCVSISNNNNPTDDGNIQWKCHCDDGWDGHDCSAPQETNCNDEIDNDNDGLVDCADSECCHHEQCGHQSLMCITSPDPLDILMRKQPPSPTSSFFQKVLFLIEDGSVQSYAQKDVYSPKRAAVIRGQVVSKELNGLIGIRVSVVNDLKYGFTLTRSDGWFDILVNGGGIITLQFQRNPFYPIKKSIYVSWNDITVIPNPIVMLLGPSDYLNESQKRFSLNRASLIFHNLFSSSDFGESNWLKWMTRYNNNININNNGSSTNSDNMKEQKNHCMEHNYEQMKPTIRDHSFMKSSKVLLTPNNEPICDNDNCIIAEMQTVQERIRIGTTQLYMIYQSSQAQGYSSSLDIQLTPSVVPKSLRFILLRILIEGNIFEKIFEADPNIQYKFNWNKRNVYKQKVYGFSHVKIYVGYYYNDCQNILWTAISTKLRGYDMEISEIGQWNLEIHNRYNPYDGIFQRGDGQFISFKDDPKLPLILESIAGTGHPRSFTCANPSECNTELRSARFFSLVSLASAPDGSIFIGDSNLIRRITPDGQIYTVYKFRANTNRQNFEYHIAFNSIDQYLYISDPDRFQIVRIQIQEKYDQEISMPEAEIVVGTGEQCFPHDRYNCDDGKTAGEVQLIYPKDLAFGLDGSLFFADGNVIRVLDTTGYVTRIVGHFNKRQWKPISCQSSHIANNIKLRWPTSLSINPIDGSLYFVDNHVLFKLNQNMKVSILFGNPSFCLEDSNFLHLENEIDCNSHQVDARTLSYCGDELFFGSIAFAPNGILYMTDINRPMENRIFALLPDGSLYHVAGFKTNDDNNKLKNSNNNHNNKQEQQCPVEKCVDMAGHNCTCLITEYGSDSNEQKIALKTKLQSVSAITTTGDGTVYLADEGKLRIYSMKYYVPQVDDQHEIKILFPNSAEMYVFNKHGQHMRTRSITTGRTLYTFVYNQENSISKLTEIIDSFGNKILFIRDKSGSLHLIESTSGLKYRATINEQGLLESFIIGGNVSYYFDYYNNGLIRSREELFTGKTYFYKYDNTNGRLKNFIQPNGALIRLYQKNDDNQNRITAIKMPILFTLSQQQQPEHFNLLNNNFDLKQIDLIIIDNSMIKFFHNGQTFELHSLPDGLLRLNTSGNMNVYLDGKVSKLSLDMLSIQARLFPLISKFTMVQMFGGQPNNNNGQSLKLEIDYNLRLKSSFIDSVEKVVTINNTSMLKIEYDWNANREIYYNQSQRPILFLQYDDYGRPIQWIPNIKEHWIANSVTYNKHGQLDTWQNGHQSQNYQRDRMGRLTEIRHSEARIRYSYSSSSSLMDNNEHSSNVGLSLPTSVTLKSGHKYSFDLDHVGLIKGIISPKGFRHNLSISLVLGSYKFSYCPPTADLAGFNIHISPSSHCYLVYFDDERSQPVMATLPYDTGKIIYHYGNRFSYSKDFGKDLFRMNDEHIVVDNVIHGNGLVERWFDRRNNRDLRGIWRNGNIEFGIHYKYARVSTMLLKHQSYLFSNIHSVSQLSYNYRYDNVWRLRSIQAKLGSINLPGCDFVYDSKGRIESIGNFRYFERSSNETLIGDGIALLVRRYDPIKQRIRHNSLTVSDKELFRADYIYDNNGLLMQTRTFMHHLGANKVRLQNFTYDADGQLVEMQDREHWKFVYDANGNLITFLYMGNRIDLEYDYADRIRSFSKSQHNSPVSGSTPYVTDLRGFVVQRGNEHLSFNNLGQLLQVNAPKQYEINYVYDYKGRLVLRRDHQKNITQYFYGHPLKPNLVTHAFNNADGRVLTLIYDDIDDLLIMVQLNNENFYVICDQSKSPVLIFDHRGQVIKEIHRSPYGHILFDSNPNFYLPVDFQGGIPDPLTNLVYFSNSGRIYDTLIGRWLVPKVNNFLNINLIKNPRAIHVYQFEQNDPINRKYKFKDEIISLTQIQKMLIEQTSLLVNQDINIPQSSILLTQFAPMLEKSHSHLLKSFSIISISSLFERLVQKFSTFQQNYYSKLQQNDWTDEQNGRSLITRRNVLFGQGIVVSCLTKDDKNFNVDDDNINGVSDILSVHFSHSIVDPVFRESLIILVNGSHLLDVHLVMAGQDHYYLVKDIDQSVTTAKLMTKFKQFQSKLNLTFQEVYLNEADKKMIVEVRIHQPSVIINIRYGTTVSKERERVLRMARKYAMQQRLLQERINIIRGVSSHMWNEQEKQFIINAKKDNLQSGPFRMDYYHSLSNQLAEDTNNIIILRRSLKSK